MENASKALIIAGAILLAILIVAMGVSIFNKAKSAADTSSLDETEINMFNQKFEKYANNQLGSQIKSLISFAISNASTNKDDQMKLPTIILNQNGTTITATGGAMASGDSQTYVNSLSSIRNTVTSTHTYNVTCDYGTSGLIKQITIDF